MHNYSYEIYDCDDSRVVCEDYFPTVVSAKDEMNAVMANFPNGCTAVVYKRYEDGEWGHEWNYVKSNGKVLMAKK